MASISSRVDEANKFLQNGNKFLKTGFLKWTPDHDNAANQFAQAAMAFKGARLHQKAIEANELAIKSYLACQNSSYQAAKCMEQAAICCKELGNYQSAVTYYRRAIDIYRSTGHMDTAIAVMERAAKSLADNMPTLAADLYIQASETAVVEDRYRQAAEFCNKAATLYLKAKEYSRAAKIAREEINCYIQANDSRNCSRISAGIILMYLAENDVVGAMDVLKHCQMDDDIYDLAQQLVTAHEKRDLKLLNSSLGNPFFRNLDTEYAKLARDLLNKYTQEDQNPDQNDDVNDLL